MMSDSSQINRTTETNQTTTSKLAIVRTASGKVDRCPVCGAAVIDRFGPWPDKTTVPGPKPPEAASVMEYRLVCSADSDHDLTPS